MEQAQGALSPAESLTISLLRNVRYHEDREAHYAFWNRALDMFTLVSGLGTVAALSGLLLEVLPDWFKTSGPLIAAAIGAVGSIVGAVQLVFALARNEHIHGDLRRRYLGLLSELDSDNVSAIDRKAKVLVAEEPPTFHAVDALAYNFAQRALDRPTGTYRVVSRSQRAWRHWFRHLDTDFPRRDPSLGS